MKSVASGVSKFLPQRPEDFMDEQDHNEWGGPVAVQGQFQRADYFNRDNDDDDAHDDDDDGKRKRQRPPSVSAILTTLIPPQNVGGRLLRVWGWRESGSTAYVPDNNTSRTVPPFLAITAQKRKGQPPVAVSAEDNNNNNDDDDVVIMEQKILSERRLRKIQLNQKRVAIPPPKLDLCGLGFEPFRDAPEFKLHKERRERLAKERAVANRNVYRVSDALGKLKESNHDDQDDDDDDDGYHGSAKAPSYSLHRTRNNNKDDAYVSYETVEDFVGSKSFGGFALHDDEDDAYDNDKPSLSKLSGPGKLRIDRDAFDTELDVGGHSDNDDEHHYHRSSPKNINLVSGIFSSWAQSSSIIGANITMKDGKSSASVSGSKGILSADGKPPLNGFVLSSFTGRDTTTKRYRGPDVPQSFDITKHVFAPQEHPLVFKALSRAEQLLIADDRNQVNVEEALQLNSITPAIAPALSSLSTTPSSSLVGAAAAGSSAFLGISAALNNRFQSSSAVVESDNKHEEEMSVKDNGGSNEKESQDAITVTRTCGSFTPNPLLCKRFKVPVPNTNSATGATTSTTTATADDPRTSGERRRINEEAYFYDEILSRLPSKNTNSNANADTKQPSQQASSWQGSSERQPSAMIKPDALMMEILRNEAPEYRSSVVANNNNNSNSVPAPPDHDNAVYKSIFDPSSSSSVDESSTDPTKDEDETSQQQQQQQPMDAELKGEERSLPQDRGSADDASKATDLDATDDDDDDDEDSKKHRSKKHKKKKKEKKRRKKKHKRKRKRSSSLEERSSDDSSSLSSSVSLDNDKRSKKDQKRSKDRRDKKRRKKHHKKR